MKKFIINNNAPIHNAPRRKQQILWFCGLYLASIAGLGLFHLFSNELIKFLSTHF